MQQNNIHTKKFISFTRQALNHLLNFKRVKITIHNKNKIELLIKIITVEKFISQYLNLNILKNLYSTNLPCPQQIINS